MSSETVDSPTMHVEASTWQRDSHELYDYESRSITRASSVIQTSHRFCRRGTEVFTCEESVAEEALASVPHGQPCIDYLMNIILTGGRYLVAPSDRLPATSTVQSKKLWQVVRDMGQYTLSEGDIIKLGRFKLKVRMICSEPSDSPQRPDLGMEGGSIGCAAPPEVDGMPCRICLMEGTGREEDPLIQACACKGSIQFVHLSCLRYWIAGRLALTETSQWTYLFSHLACELCKTPYPVQIKLADGSQCQLVPMPETKAPFIVLENLMRAEVASDTRAVYVISLAGKTTLKLGRGHESDVRIADVSISRWHATVSFTQDRRFVLEDHGSKFGTLVLIRSPVLFDNALTVQSGRTVFRLMGAGEYARYSASQDAPHLSDEQ